ncbi:hypothetical protein HDV01_005705 [Terramyces sp. JEL0728]|nr:hypothetical protein HDV01_005705 [Terramyces sp. JEL0728]
MFHSMRAAYILILFARGQSSANNTAESSVDSTPVLSSSATAIIPTAIPTTLPPATHQPTVVKTTVVASKATTTSSPETSPTVDTNKSAIVQSSTVTQPTTTGIPSVAAVSSSDSSSSNSFIVIYVFAGFLISAFVATGFAFFLIRRKEKDRKVGRVLALEEQQVHSDKTIYDNEKTIQSEVYERPPSHPQTVAYATAPMNPYRTDVQSNYYDDAGYYQYDYGSQEMYTLNSQPLPAYPYSYSYGPMSHPHEVTHMENLAAENADYKELQAVPLSRPPSKLQKALSKINTDDKLLGFDILLNELNDTAEILSPDSLNSAPFEFTHYNLPSADGVQPVLKQTSIDDLALYSEYYTTPRHPNFRVSISDTAGYTFFMKESKEFSNKLLKTNSRMSIDTVLTRKSMRMSRYDTLRSRLSLAPNQSLNTKASIATLATEVDPTE